MCIYLLHISAMPHVDSSIAALTKLKTGILDYLFISTRSKHDMKILDVSEPEFGAPMTEYEVRDFLINSKKKFTSHHWITKENLTFIPHGIILTMTTTNFT